jgi:DNA-binding IclR family transcriptional regulator
MTVLPADRDRPVGDRSAHPATVIGKVRQVMEALGGQGHPVGPSALARSTALPKSTVFRLCQELAEWGVIERVGTSFRLGSQFTALAMSPSASDHFRDVAGAYAVDLYAATRMTTKLSVLVGGDVVCIEKISGARDTSSGLQVGSRAPAHSSAPGRAILAFSAPSTVESVLSRPLVRTTPFSLASPGRLTKELVAIRESQVAYSREEVRLGQAALASPVFGPDGNVIGALAVSLKSTDVPSPDIRGALRTQARALSLALHAPSR